MINQIYRQQFCTEKDGSSQIVGEGDQAVQKMFRDKINDQRDFFNPAADEDRAVIAQVQDPAERKMLEDIYWAKVRTRKEEAR